MNATRKSQKTVNVNLSLSSADYEWFEAYANFTGRTLSEAASKGIEALIEKANAKTATVVTPGKAECDGPSNLIVFPSR